MSVSKSKSSSFSQVSSFTDILLLIIFYILLFIINSSLALRVHLPVFSVFKNDTLNDPYIDLKRRINGLKSYLPSMQWPVWAGLYSVCESTWATPDFACKLPASRDSLIRASAKVSAKSIFYITNIEQLEIPPNRCSWGGHDCFTAKSRAAETHPSSLLYSEGLNLWSCWFLCRQRCQIWLQPSPG